jgi:hypothetical protein
MLKEIVIAAIFIGMFVLVPIVYLLTRMQTRMATLVHRRSDDQLVARVAQLENEVANLHQTLRFVRSDVAGYDSLPVGNLPANRQ